MSVFQEISDYIDTISVIDTHCHKLPRQVGFPAGIQDLSGMNTYNLTHFTTIF